MSMRLSALNRVRSRMYKKNLYDLQIKSKRSEMPLFKNEPALAEYWKTRLEEKYLKVFKSVRLSSRKFEQRWIKWWGPTVPPGQPDIDLLIVDKQRRLHGVELKYFTKAKKRRLSQSYYEGIDESLALLRFGLESVNLWHCFDKEVPKFLFGQYHSTASKLIQSLKLPICYEGLYLDLYQDEIQAYPIISGEPSIYIDKDGKRATPILPFIGLKKNPLKEEPDAKKTLDFLRIQHEIPS